MVFRVATGDLTGADPKIREVLVPYTAWPLPHIRRVLLERLRQMPPLRSRPIVGDAQDDAFLVKLDTFLLRPLLSAEENGTAGPLGGVHFLSKKSPSYDNNVRQMKLLAGSG